MRLSRQSSNIKLEYNSVLNALLLIVEGGDINGRSGFFRLKGGNTAPFTAAYFFLPNFYLAQINVRTEESFDDPKQTVLSREAVTNTSPSGAHAQSQIILP